MRVVIALGGNALLKRDQSLDYEVQRQNVRLAARSIAEVARSHAVIVTHGNGPQVGLLALQAAAYVAVPPYPLDVLGAESEGMIGYIIEQELMAALPGRPVATLLTQVEVDPNDPAFASPTKPIGPVYDEATADRLRREKAWPFCRDGAGFRRVVASPIPRRILEVNALRLLVEAGVLVVCAGGGGIPVTIDAAGAVRGMEAVIDKDRSAALLAVELGADALLLLTDVDAVYADWLGAKVDAIRSTTPATMRRMAFDAGSMGPKVEAACGFVEATDRMAGIGALGDAAKILRGASGTIVRNA
ncbi:MAG: carbamate kinase [Alphaproteobacteria bacterium]